MYIYTEETIILYTHTAHIGLLCIRQIGGDTRTKGAFHTSIWTKEEDFRRHYISILYGMIIGLICLSI